MIAEIFRQNRYNKGFQTGVAAVQESWAGWNRRREQAETEGREFTEPHPTLESIRKGMQLPSQRPL